MTGASDALEQVEKTNEDSQLGTVSLFHEGRSLSRKSGSVCLNP